MYYSDFRLKIRFRSTQAGLTRIGNLVRVHLDWWLGLNQIDFQPIFIERDSKRFSDWFEIIRKDISEWLGFGLIWSVRIPIRNFLQGYLSTRNLLSKYIVCLTKCMAEFGIMNQKEVVNIGITTRTKILLLFATHADADKSIYCLWNTSI